MGLSIFARRRLALLSLLLYREVALPAVTWFAQCLQVFHDGLTTLCPGKLVIDTGRLPGFAQD